MIQTIIWSLLLFVGESVRSLALPHDEDTQQTNSVTKEIGKLFHSHSLFVSSLWSTTLITNVPPNSVSL